MISENVKEFIIHGSTDYVCLMDSRRVIIERSPVPPKNDFLWESIDTIFEKYKSKLTFELVGEKPYPHLPNDKYNIMKEKNPALKYLKRKFMCEVY